MPRLARNRSRASLGGITLYADQAVPLHLRLDTHRQGFAIRTTWLPNDPQDGGAPGIREWAWQNGQGGAGTTVETPSSYRDGACDHGEFVWLRRLGVAQPAGKLTELALPALAANATTGRFTCGRVFGPTNDLFLTTRNRTIVKVPNGTGLVAPQVVDCGSGAVTAGAAVFAGSGTSRLYVGDTQHGIWATADGTTWTSGGVGTERAFLETPYWTLGPALSTGGLAGQSGNGHDILVGTDAGGTGFYHVSGDPQITANWSALTTVGVGGSIYPIASTVASNRVFWAVNGLGVWGVDEVGHAPNLAKFDELIASAHGGLTSAYWDGKVWFATEQGLAVILPDGRRLDVGTFVQFGAGSGASPIHGRPRAVAACEDGLYVGYHNVATLTSYVGLLMLDPGGGYRWSMAEAVIPGQEIDFIQQVSGDDRITRLFMGTRDPAGGLHLFVQSLPRTGDPESDFDQAAPFEAAPEWSLTLSRFGGGRAVKKVFRQLMLETDRLGTSFPANSVEIHTAMDGDAFTLQGTATTGRWKAQPKHGSVRAVSAQIKLVCHNTTSQPIAVRTVSARYSPRPELTKTTTYPIVIGEAISGQDPGVVLAHLERAQEDDPIQVTDHYGRTIEAMVEPTLQESIAEEAAGKGWTVHADLTITQTRRVTRFDVGDRFSAGESFG